MKQRLAETLARYANEVLISSEVNVPGLNVALSLLQESIRLDPNHPETYRKLITLAILIDREDLLNEATQGLLKDRPDDTRARLNRLEVAIDGFNTAQDQMNALEQLLKPEVARSLGPEISARLAFRLADLHRRRGDLQEFGRWLGIDRDGPHLLGCRRYRHGILRDRVPNQIAYVELLPWTARRI